MIKFWCKNNLEQRHLSLLFTLPIVSLLSVDCNNGGNEIRGESSIYSHEKKASRLKASSHRSMKAYKLLSLRKNYFNPGNFCCRSAWVRQFVLPLSLCSADGVMDWMDCRLSSTYTPLTSGLPYEFLRNQTKWRVMSVCLLMSSTVFQRYRQSSTYTPAAHVRQSCSWFFG